MSLASARFSFSASSWSDFPSPRDQQFGARLSSNMYWAGKAFFAGLAPDPLDPESPDGRFRILNVPSRGRITVHERSSMICVADTLSASDGTWYVGRLRPDVFYTVIGWDDNGFQNAALQDWVKPVLPE